MIYSYCSDWKCRKLDISVINAYRVCWRPLGKTNTPLHGFRQRLGERSICMVRRIHLNTVDIHNDVNSCLIEHLHFPVWTEMLIRFTLEASMCHYLLKIQLVGPIINSNNSKKYTFSIDKNITSEWWVVTFMGMHVSVLIPLLFLNHYLIFLQDNQTRKGSMSKTVS